MIVWITLGAIGLALTATGLPVLGGSHLARRVEPYLRGLNDALQPVGATEGFGLGAFVPRWIAGLLPGTEAELERRLAAAQLDPRATAFRTEQLIWALAAAGSVFFVIVGMSTTGRAMNPAAVPLLTAVAFLTGALARDWWLTRQVKSRHASLKEELPTAIDLVTLSIMAGESVPAAFARVAGILESGIGGVLGDAVGEMRTGVPAVDALERMKARLPDPQVARFVDALVTGIERGAPLADVLRAQADDCREARRRELLELGGKREVLMLVPVVFLIMPVVVVYALLPGLASLNLLVP